MQRICMTRIDLKNRTVQAPGFLQLPAAVLICRRCK
jgi:hypothetical protein